MPKSKEKKDCLKIIQLLAASDIQSSLVEKYIEYNLHEVDINFRISDDTILKFTKPEYLRCTLLHLAYKNNKLKLFNLLLKHGADFTIKNRQDCTVLHQIIQDTYEKGAENSELKAISDNPFVISVLDATVVSENFYNPCDERGISHFHIACMANHKPAVECFLKTSSLHNQAVFKKSPVFPGYTSLHFAARFSNAEIVKMLLECGVTHNIVDIKGMTPLHLLIHRNIAIADLLNKNKVLNVEQLTTQRKINEDIIHMILNISRGPTDYVIDHTNLSRLHIACIVESLPLTEDLLHNFEQINQKVNLRSSPLSGNTALHFAVLCNVEKAKLLLRRGADIHLKNVNGQTALDLCIDRYEVKDIYDIVASQPALSQVRLSVHWGTLLDVLFSIHTLDLSRFETRNNNITNPIISKQSPLWPGRSLLHLAVHLSERGCKNDQVFVKQLSFPKSWTSHVLDNGISPLHLAYRQKKPEVVDFLLKSRLNAVNRVDCNKLSHLHVACAAGVTAAVEKLLLAGADVNLQMMASFGWFRHPRSDCNAPREVYIPKGSTPLHVAVIVGHCETMKLLLARGADVCVRDEHGMTPIHWLLASDNPISPAADILLSTSPTASSANGNKRFATSSILENCVTDTGLSHLHVACLAENLDVAEKLLEEDASRIDAISLCNVVDGAKKFPGKVRYVGYAPLHLALARKNTKLVRLLIQRGANVLVNNPVKHSIPLYEAFIKESSRCVNVLRNMFQRNETLQRQVEEHSGLTVLHFYCAMLDDEAVEKILSGGATDVNKPLLTSSPIWPGFTPLHVLMKCYRASSRNADNLLRSLLYHGADVTLTNAEKETPLHLACDLDFAISSKVFPVKTLLRSQKNFNINPQNSRGLSHFHVACANVDVITIERFLKRNVDVNQSIDYFFENRGDSEFNGRTPLHLILSCPLNQNVEVTVKLKAVTTLIQHGADVCAEDVFGNTPLHLAAKHHPQSIDLLNTIIDGGGNMYAKNIFGQTPLEIVLNSKEVTVDGVKVFLDHGYCPNAFNSITERGFIAAIFSTDSYFQQQLSIFQLIVNACGDVLDEMGRTVLHNVVSTSTAVISDELYTKIVESLLKIVDIDQQDNLGRTALHVAAQFKNHGGVFALLQAGADINIIDANEKTAFVYAFETSPFFERSLDNSETIVRIFSSYVQKLNVCVLEVHEMNSSALIEAFKNYTVNSTVSQGFYDELKYMKDVKIGSNTSITLLDLISCANMQSARLCTSRLKHDIVNNLFEIIDETCFIESIGIIRLQCRKIIRKSVFH